MATSPFMLEAIALSRKAIQTSQGGPFGAVIVQGHAIIAKAHNEVLATHDPTAHAEVVAIRRAAAKLERHVLDDCTIFTSCEPCPMCLGAIYWARLRAIHFANTRGDAARIGFDDEFFYKELACGKDQRQVPMIQEGIEEARLVFDEFLAMPNRQLY